MIKSEYSWLMEAIDKWEKVTIEEYLDQALREDIDLDTIDDKLYFIIGHANQKRIAVKKKYKIY